MGQDAPQRIRKSKYTDQEIRTGSIEIRDELFATVEFIAESIREDRLRLKLYKEFHGDLRYRPIIKQGETFETTTYGAPTDTVLEPLASQYRATINSLLQSIRLIQDEILTPEDAEDASGSKVAPNEPIASIRDEFKKASKSTKSQPKPIEDDSDSPDSSPSVSNKESSTKLVAKSNTIDTASISLSDVRSSTAETEVSPEVKVSTTELIRPQAKFIPNIKPNRDEPPTPPQAPPAPQGPIGLSPALRMRLQMSGSMQEPSRLDSIKDKYKKDK